MNTHRFKAGDRVRSSEGHTWSGTVQWNKPPNAALAGCYLVAFENGTTQWMPGHLLTLAELDEDEGEGWNWEPDVPAFCGVCGEYHGLPACKATGRSPDED